jgi:thioredoxin
MIAPIIEQLASELAGRVRVAKLNIDENPMTAARYNVQSIPTLLVFQNGEVKDRIIGASPKAEILRRLQATPG